MHQRLSFRQTPSERLDIAVIALSAPGLGGVRQRRRAPRVGPNRLGHHAGRPGEALRILGERENSTAWLEQAVATHREALKELTRERVPVRWAVAQFNLGHALFILRERGTARLEQAAAAYSEALNELTPERQYLEWAWAQATASHGVALSRLAERLGDTAMAQSAVGQIDLAFETMRGWPSAAHYEAELTKARAISDRLSKR
jgi:hypothetical protein